jgi:hypothetical protein
MLSRPTEEEHEYIFQELFVQGPYVRFACPLTSFRLNERLAIQKGTFLIPGSLECSFEENLMEMSGYNNEENVIKIALPGGTFRDQTLEKLFYMTISQTNLYPGLDGFARSLGVFHPAFRRLDLVARATAPNGRALQPSSEDGTGN